MSQLPVHRKHVSEIEARVNPIDACSARLAQLTQLPLPSRGRDSRRRASQLIDSLTELQKLRYDAVLGRTA